MEGSCKYFVTPSRANQTKYLEHIFANMGQLGNVVIAATSPVQKLLMLFEIYNRG